MDSQPTCPKCGSIIYSRRSPVCGRCGEKLPESLIFDAATRKQIDAEMDQARKRRQWDAKFPEPGCSGPDIPTL